MMIQSSSFGRRRAGWFGLVKALVSRGVGRDPLLYQGENNSKR